MNQGRNVSRRGLLRGALFGSGYVGLRSLASGLPIAALVAGVPSDEAIAAEGPDRPQFVIMNSGGRGDPFNALVPGIYDLPTGPTGDKGQKIRLNPHEEMRAVALKLGSVRTKACAPLATLPQWALDRTAFIHHRTYQNAHPQFTKVLGLVGSGKSETGSGSEQLGSILASSLASALGTIQREPVSLQFGGLSFEGRSIQKLPPRALKTLFAPQEGRAALLQKMRDEALNKVNAELRTNGTHAQRQWLERHANSRAQVRQIDDGLLSRLAMIENDGAQSQVLTAITLILMKVAPVINVYIPFGGDNHGDNDLEDECDDALEGFASLKLLFEELKREGLEDRVTFANLNVFGRTLREQDNKGRDHNLAHHVMMITGQAIKPGVIGKIIPVKSDFGATGIDSASGEGREEGADIPETETLEAAAKTLALAAGVPAEIIERRIVGGKPIAASLA